jgi:hypothetical protein
LEPLPCEREASNDVDWDVPEFPRLLDTFLGSAKEKWRLKLTDGQQQLILLVLDDELIRILDRVLIQPTPEKA